MSTTHSPLSYNVEQLLEELDRLFKELGVLRGALRDVEFAVVPSRGEDFNLQQRFQQLKSHRDKIKERVEKALLYPPKMARHFDKLREFHTTADHDQSVMIMTKFLRAGDPESAHLDRVIDAVRAAVAECGYYPRLASDIEYYDRVWDNVELYLLGCGKGIAILEDKVLPELNPNVAAEWGWMKAMGRDVFLLVEESFDSLRADWHGTIAHNFRWNDPEEGIRREIRNWLLPMGAGAVGVRA